MDTNAIIEKYYDKNSELYHILIEHSHCVTQKALKIAANHPELKIETQFVSEAGMLHDIGIFLTHAPSIQCYGKENYICHGMLGRQLLEQEGYPLHARVCEHHTGAGLTKEEIIAQNLPLPHCDMLPTTIEEEVICFADCFFSKTHLGEEKTLEQIRRKFEKFGARSVNQFNEWCEKFL